MKNLLAICSHAPYGNNLAKEGIDAILAAGVFEQNLSVIFLDDGIFQLLKNQQSSAIQQKNISDAISALPLFGIESLFVEHESLEERGLVLSDLILDELQLIARADIPSLINNQDQVFSF
jgi:tRNA 2-thiouridine synthesizing protein C